MTDQVIQASFNSGEWSPKLYARVDLAKYRSGAALLENFFVDYRGGASTRPGTKYILQCFKSATAVRLIPFQASFAVGYVLEFGDQYVRFFFNGGPVLESALTITAATSASPGVFTHNSHGYSNGDWVLALTFAGGTWSQLNGNYYIVAGVTTNTFTLTDLFGTAINTTGFGTYTGSTGTTARVYTIASPYTASELAKLKFAQNVSQLILCHTNHQPYVLTLITATNWTLLPISIGSTATVPSPVSLTVSFPAPGTNPQAVFYSYVITSIDGNGQESSPSIPIGFGATYDIRTVAGSLSIVWAVAAGAVGYNIYRANVSYFGAIPAGATYGFIGSTTGTTFIDSNIAPDFTQTPPIAKNPFLGSGVASVAVTSASTYTTVPGVSFTGASTISASATATLTVQGTPTVGSGGANYVVGDSVSFTNGVVLIVATLAGSAVATWQAASFVGASAGQVTAGSTPANPVVQISTSGIGTGATANLTWGVGFVTVTVPGAGYGGAPTVVFSAGAATATATLGASSAGFPTVPGFFQQRLILGAPVGAPQTLYFSQPGNYFNFNVSQIAEPDDSITATLISGQLGTIKALVPQTSGLLTFTDRNSWLINGGSPGSAITPSALVANAQSFNGIADVQPIISNFDVLYVQAKGSIIRDSAYNIYANVYTGTDISAIASHLFFGFTVKEWAWAEEPFKLVWAVRSDGAMLTLTFLKEQEFIGWAHSTTTGGSFESVATVVENTSTAGEIDAVYTVVQRTVQGQSLQYIERVAERTFPTGVADAWCVDCGINYTGAPATTFSGAQFLAGLTVTGLADGVVIPPFVMPTSGTFTLPSASKVTVGIGFTPKLQTLAIEVGDPTIQGKLKKINSVDVRVADTLGLSIGSDFTHLVAMKDLVVGNVSSMLVGQSSQLITGLVNGDARTFLDPTYTIPGQYCIQQSSPLPATVLGVIPNITVGDDGGRKG